MILPSVRLLALFLSAWFPRGVFNPVRKETGRARARANGVKVRVDDNYYGLLLGLQHGL